MGSESVIIPENYVDILVEEFAYDPIRLALSEDPAQVLLYNRRTLEAIWDMKHEAVNPFTRQPFDIRNVIPQGELRQEMCEYIESNRSLEVIPDYSRVLSERDMKKLLNGLISDFNRLINANKSKKRKREEQQLWKPLWQRFNLLRLYCQYKAENRELFSSIKGYERLRQVVNEKLYILFSASYSSCDDAKEVCKEVARIVDVIGFKESDLATVPEDLLWAFVHILAYLANECVYMKIRSMVLRIFRRMFYDIGIDCKLVFCSCTVQTALYMLERDDVSNEDLYNGMSVLKVAWVKNQDICISAFGYVEVILDVVNICISRLKDLHADPDRATNYNRHENDEEENNINMISIALDRGLCVINSILTIPSYDGEDAGFFSLSKKTLRDLDTGGVIIRMLKLVLSGYKHLGLSHLHFGINIAGTLYKEEGGRRRDHVFRVFRDFLGSDIVDEYSGVQPLLEHFMPH